MPTDKRFMVLRFPAARATGARAGTRTLRGGSPPPPGATIEIVSNNDDDPGSRRGLRTDPTVGAIAPARFPIRLVRNACWAEPATLAPTVVGWGLRAVGADRASQNNLTGRGVTVAVLDTGIDRTHPAFSDPQLQVLSRNFVEGEPENLVVDEDGHGTHCAGTIFGRDVGGQRIGVAPGIQRALIGKVIGKSGGSLEGIIHGIRWAVEEGADIISMSLGVDYTRYQAELAATMPPEIATSRALVEYTETVKLFERLNDFIASLIGLRKRSVLIVAASGNESRRDEDPEWTVAASPPSNARGVLSVGALDHRGAHLRVASFSNTDPAVSAPGVDIVSAWPGGGLRALSGTSMATPHVAGVAALWAQKLGNPFDAHLVKEKLIGSCLDKLPGFSRENLGSGLVQAPQA